MTSARLGILGGTFDPIHRGHVVMAEQCLAQVGLNEVWFVPVGDPPHKRDRLISPASDRVAMVELAIADNPHFRLSRIEVDRPGVSYSVDTVREIRNRVEPATELYFIIGQDSLLDLPRWREPERLLAYCRIIAVNRPGYRQVDLTQLGPVIANARDRISFVEMAPFDIAASDVRRRVAARASITDLVPESVENYVVEQGLYREASEERAETPGVRRQKTG